MKKLDVHLTLPDANSLFCGEIVCREPDSRGRIAGAFRYREDFLNNPAAFALDPRALVLSSREYETNRPTGVPGVFEDSLPDDWGRRLMVRKADLPRSGQTVPNLLSVLGGNGLGALAYFEKGTDPGKQTGTNLAGLQDLLEVAWRYDAGEIVAKNELHMLFKAASSPGGARPKALIRTDDGSQWIAKFPSSRDRLPVVPIEAATLSLAAEAGITVPDFKVVPVGRRQVLLVRRFDVTRAGGRRHMLSFQSLLGAEGYYRLGYPDLFESLRKYSFQPQIDTRALYRQMVFNAAIGNTDDHLKNFTLLHDDAGYYLSPAYDLLPDTADRREHVLYFENSHLAPDRSALLRLARRLGIGNTANMVDEVRQAVAGWRGKFKEFGIADKTIKQIEPGISKRVSALV